MGVGFAAPKEERGAVAGAPKVLFEAELGIERSLQKVTPNNTEVAFWGWALRPKEERGAVVGAPGWLFGGELCEAEAGAWTDPGSHFPPRKSFISYPKKRI